MQEDRGIRPGYKLKLNSYDLGVDIELHDALQRIRFEHPEVRSVIVTSGKDRIFCSGANIFMLGLSSHAWKVNFCKFTNETRNGIEDASRNSGLKFIAACNGTTAGGGYELALACDEIFLVDDRSSAVSLPEVPLLGVLAGHRRADAADRQAQGAARSRGYFLHDDRRRARRARQGSGGWSMPSSSRSSFGAEVKRRALELAAQSDRPADANGCRADSAEAHDRRSGLSLRVRRCRRSIARRDARR